MDDPTETKEYFAGYEWAGTNSNRLRELYTEREIATPELRSMFFTEAARVYPAGPGDMENDFRQTLWVVGAMRFVVDKLPATRESAAAMFDAAMELGAVLSAEYWKLQCSKDLKAKSAKWWKKKAGDATPDDVVAALAIGWRRRFAKEKQRPMPDSKWEVLADMTGSREMCILAELKEIELVKDGEYWYYRVSAKDRHFEMIMRPAYHNGIMHQAPGDIIG
jgi:hypothetical protein